MQHCRRVTPVQELPRVKNVTSGCTRGGTKLFVDLNNVKAVIKTHGGMWQDGNASYEVQKVVVSILFLQVEFGLPELTLMVNCVLQPEFSTTMVKMTIGPVH